MFSCTECGRCSSQCPGHRHRQAAGAAPAAPRPARLPLRAPGRGGREAHRGAARTATAPSRPRWARTSSARSIQDEVLWACNMCRACEESCPVMIEYVDKIVDMRRHLVQEEARFPSRADAHLQGHGDAVEPVGRRRRRSASTGPTGSTSRPSPTSPTPSTSTTSAAPARSTIATRRPRRRSRASSRRPASTSPSWRRRSRATARRRAASATSTSTRAWRRWRSRRFNGYEREEGHRELPALLQHDQERVPAVRRQLRGDPRRRAGEAADRGRASSQMNGGFDKRTVVPRLLLLRPLQRRLRRAARRPRARPARRSRRCRATTTASACAAAPAAVACGSRKTADKRVNLLRTDQALADQSRGRSRCRARSA